MAARDLRIRVIGRAAVLDAVADVAACTSNVQKKLRYR